MMVMMTIWKQPEEIGLSNAITPPVAGTVMDLFLILIEENDIEQRFTNR